MFFTEQQLRDIRRDYAAIEAKRLLLLDLYLNREFANERAREFARHGFPRRLKAMARCIRNVFTLLPPERTDPPESDVLHDAEINIQACVFNTFAATENLAWIWVSEKNIQHDGAPLRDRYISLRKDRVVDSFSAAFREYLQGTLHTWFGHLENYRHALAHRIPLYIPPYVLSQDQEAAYRDLEARMAQAAGRFDFDERARLQAEQMRLVRFHPIMKHSFSEQAKTVIFHPQLIADFKTIDELGRRMIEELDR